jgi:hypothetical protein
MQRCTNTLLGWGWGCWRLLVHSALHPEGSGRAAALAAPAPAAAAAACAARGDLRQGDPPLFMVMGCFHVIVQAIVGDEEGSGQQ